MGMQATLLFEQTRLHLHRQEITGSTTCTSFGTTSIQSTSGTAALSIRSLQGTLIAFEPH